MWSTTLADAGLREPHLVPEGRLFDGLRQVDGGDLPHRLKEPDRVPLSSHRVDPDRPGADWMTISYKVAILARCPVQAIALRYPHRDGVHPAVPFVGDASLLPHLWRLLGERRIEVTLRFCEPLSALGRTRNELAEHARAQIDGALSGAGTARPLVSTLLGQA